MMISRAILAMSAAAAVITGALFLALSLLDREPSEPVAQVEFDRATRAFAEAFKGEGAGLEALEEFGFSAGHSKGKEVTIELSETGTDCTAKGIYWIDQDTDSALAISAPHSMSDQHTGTLAEMLFLESNARGAAWNSAPRRVNEDCDNAVDLARSNEHVFNAFHLGFAQAFPDGLIVQLHGFEGEQRVDPATRDAAMILSDGTRTPGKKLLRLADQLSLAFAPLEVLVFPIGSQELGATENVQGKSLREAGFDGFVHIEISARMRAAMLQNTELRERLSQALVRGAA